MANVQVVLALIGSIVLGTLWVENRYQQVSSSICQIGKDVISREMDGNEIRLEFYNNELEHTMSDKRIKFLDSSTSTLSARQRVLKNQKDSISC